MTDKHARAKAMGKDCLRRAAQRFQDIGQAEQIPQHIDPATEAYYHTLMASAPKNYLVGHTQWGTAFKSLFVDLLSENHQKLSTQPPDEHAVHLDEVTKHILVRSAGHAMSMEFKIKQPDSAAPQYVLSFWSAPLRLEDKEEKN